MNPTILITGGTGFLGRHLTRLWGGNIRSVGTENADLTDYDAARSLFAVLRPHTVFHLAAVCGGIGANRASPLRFLTDNTRIGLNIVEACLEFGVKRLIAVGTVCAYPKFTPIPFRELDMWNGYPEETNAPYGIAKRLLGEACRIANARYGLSTAFALPANLYGPGDNFNPQTSHVIPAIIKAMTDAKARGESSVTLWGTGRPTRDFLYAPDCAEALTILGTSGMNGSVNIGTGRETSIAELADIIATATGYTGTIRWDASQPDGQPRRVLNTDRMNRMWKPRHTLEQGIRATVEWWRSNEQGI